MKKLGLALVVVLAIILLASCSVESPTSEPAPSIPQTSALAIFSALATASSSTPDASLNPSPSGPKSGGAYTWEEAVNHIGEVATVTGPIVDSIDWAVMGVGSDISLGMGKSVNDGTAFGVAVSLDRGKIPADLYKGKIIAVTGQIGVRSFGGGAKIAVTDLSQIVILEESSTATTGFAIAGEWVQTSQVQDFAPVTENGKLTIKATTSQDWKGTMEGKFSSKFVEQIDLTTGKISIADEGFFSGTVNGKLGTFTTSGSGNGQMVSQTSGTISIESKITGGTDDLKDL